MNRFISTKLLEFYVRSLKIFIKYSSNIPYKFDLGNQMKSLNDKKQFRNAIEVFDKHMKSNSKAYPSLVITQALKACANIKDYQRGLQIHQLIASRVEQDIHILTSLIHFYSK